jgi:hypothetical protein
LLERTPGTRRATRLDLNDLRKRVQRLEELSRGLAREILLWRECNDPLLYRERQDYLKAIREAWAGVEGARVLLAKARQRLEKQAR